jgi:hypothetical protein
LQRVLDAPDCKRQFRRVGVKNVKYGQKQQRFLVVDVLINEPGADPGAAGYILDLGPVVTLFRKQVDRRSNNLRASLLNRGALFAGVLRP